MQSRATKGSTPDLGSGERTERRKKIPQENAELWKKPLNSSLLGPLLSSFDSAT